MVYKIIDVFIQNGKLHSSFIEIGETESKTQEIYHPEREKILKRNGRDLKKDTKYEWYREYLDYKDFLCQYKTEEQMNESLMTTKTLLEQQITSVNHSKQIELLKKDSAYKNDIIHKLLTDIIKLQQDYDKLTKEILQPLHILPLRVLSSAPSDGAQPPAYSAEL